ncbi:MAG: hypothetical protein RL367_155, partial [Pseudomonadota bacterium]
MTDAEITARQADILGKPQRIEPWSPEEFDENAVALVRAIKASLGHGDDRDIPEVFGVMLKHPWLFRCQIEIGTLFFSQGRIAPRERELAVLRVGWLCRAPYEWGEHVNIGKRNGLTLDEIERVTLGSTAPQWSAHDRAILAGVEELVGDHMISDATWGTLAKSWDEAQLLEFPMLVGQYC